MAGDEPRDASSVFAIGMWKATPSHAIWRRLDANLRKALELVLAFAEGKSRCDESRTSLTLPEPLFGWVPRKRVNMSNAAVVTGPKIRIVPKGEVPRGSFASVANDQNWLLARVINGDHETPAELIAATQ